MRENLIGYLMDGLTVEEATSVERVLLDDEGLTVELEILRTALIPLEADRGEVDAPSELALRTCERIRILRAEMCLIEREPTGNEVVE